MSEAKKSALSKIPAFRIEVHDPEKALWWPIEFAHTEAQADKRLARRIKEFGRGNARLVPNGANCDRKVFLELVDLATISLSRNLIDLVNSEKLAEKFSKLYGITLSEIPTADEMRETFAKLLDGELPPDFPVAIDLSNIPRLYPEPTEPFVFVPADNFTSLKPEPVAVEIPFVEGDNIEDIHTGWHLRVTKVYGVDGTGRAFDWENLAEDAKEKTGTINLNAVENFIAVKEPKPRKKRKSD